MNYLTGVYATIAIAINLIPANTITIVASAPPPSRPIPAVIQKLIRCESQGQNRKEVDSNGYYSYGILQYQSSTWNGWSRRSGIMGNPMVPADAIRMAEWAIAQPGLLGHWTCAHILHLVD